MTAAKIADLGTVQDCSELDQQLNEHTETEEKVQFFDSLPVVVREFYGREVVVLRYSRGNTIFFLLAKRQMCCS